jgi:hypothetical protein
MGYMQQAGPKRVVTKVKQAQGGTLKSGHATRTDEILQSVQQMASLQHYDKAIDLLNAAGRERQLLNAKGVCLMRLGRFQDAMRLYYSLVLSPGCTWTRPDVPLVYKTNYATALVLGGNLSGCLAILAELNAEQNPTVRRLRGAIKAWESRLTFWQKLNWRFGRIEPAGCAVTVDFEPGEFEQLPARNDAPPVAPRQTPKAA